jgi:hypothetical protein
VFPLLQVVVFAKICILVLRTDPGIITNVVSLHELIDMISFMMSYVRILYLRRVFLFVPKITKRLQLSFEIASGLLPSR